MGLDLPGFSPMPSGNIPVFIQSGPTLLLSWVSFLLTLEQGQELFKHPHRSPHTFAWPLAHWEALFLSLEEVILGYQPALLNPISLQCWIPRILPRASLKRLKLALPESIVAILLPALFPPCLILNSKSHGHCRQGCSQPSYLQSWNLPCLSAWGWRAHYFLWELHYLCQEVVTSAFKEPPGWIVCASLSLLQLMSV